MCDAAGTMGIVTWSQGDFERAQAFCEQSIEIAKEIGHQWAVGRAAITLGNCAASQNNYAQALVWYQMALDVASEMGDRQCVGWAISNIGGLYEKQGDLDRALACEASAMRNALEIGDKWSASIALANMGEYTAARGYPDRAELLYDKAIALGRALNMNYLHNYLSSLAEFYTDQGRYREAQSLNDKALALALQAGEERMGGEDILFKIRVLKVRLRLALGEIDLPTAVNKLERLLTACQGPEREAGVSYAIWRLDPDQETHRRTAADGYRSLYAGVPNSEYRRIYQELTGEVLPAPPPLPDLPQIAMGTDLDLESMLAQVDQILADLAQDRP
jgi:tetratricopeptide (TPR) repeat protein